MSVSRLVLMVGIPGSGKSTWIKQEISRLKLLNKNSIVISRDCIRKAMIGNNPSENTYFSRETEVFNEFVRQINEALKNDTDTVFIDATHISIGSRKKILNRLLPESCTVLNIVVMATPESICKERNSKRTGFAHVPESGMNNMIKGYQEPDFNEFPDNKYGFKDIIISKIYTINEEGKHEQDLGN